MSKVPGPETHKENASRNKIPFYFYTVTEEEFTFYFFRSNRVYLAVDISGSLASFIITVGKSSRRHLGLGAHSRDPLILRMLTTLTGFPLPEEGGDAENVLMFGHAYKMADTLPRALFRV